jgi:hypothetical protein
MKKLMFVIQVLMSSRGSEVQKLKKSEAELQAQKL